MVVDTIHKNIDYNHFWNKCLHSLQSPPTSSSCQTDDTSKYSGDTEDYKPKSKVSFFSFVKRFLKNLFFRTIMITKVDKYN